MLQPVPAMCPAVLLGQTRGEHVMPGIQSLYHAYTCSKIRHITRIVHIMPQLSLNVLYRQDIQYGANCPIVAHNSSIKLDEFEYDVTSVRPDAHTCIHVHMCPSKSSSRTQPSSQHVVVHHSSRRSDEDDGVVLWNDYDISRRRGTTLHIPYVCRCTIPHIP